MTNRRTAARHQIEIVRDLPGFVEHDGELVADGAEHLAIVVLGPFQPGDVRAQLGDVVILIR